MTNAEQPTAADAPAAPTAPGHPVRERMEARAAEVGELPIHRAIPNRQRRMVGAWCFLDHAGPIDYPAGQGLRVGPHPHIGLQTFTWMIEGEILHRDSLGHEQVIRPGQVNLMTAGRGIAHAEDAASPAASRLHAVQLWIALPEAERRRAPAFEHYPTLPVLHDGGFTITLLAGNAFGQRAPTRVYSPLVGLDVAADGAARVQVPLQPDFEYAALVLTGKARVEGDMLTPNTLLYLGTGGHRLELACDDACRLIILGGEPFGEEILLWWNFVARHPEEMAQATAAWNTGTSFGEVKGSPSPRLAAPDISGLRLRAIRP